MEEAQRSPLVFTEKCLHCNEAFENNKLVWYIGAPYFCILHEQCAPFFDYSKGWPHDHSFDFYKPNSSIVRKWQTAQFIVPPAWKTPPSW